MSAVKDLFDRWEKVWHEGQYDLIPGCMASSCIRHSARHGLRRLDQGRHVAIQRIRADRTVLRRPRPHGPAWNCQRASDGVELEKRWGTSDRGTSRLLRRAPKPRAGTGSGNYMFINNLHCGAPHMSSAPSATERNRSTPILTRRRLDHVRNGYSGRCWKSTATRPRCLKYAAALR
jgi:hypothetical protein